MATLTVTSLVLGAATSSGQPMTVAGCSSGGDKFLNTGREIVVFQATSSNAGVGTTCTVTFVAQGVDSFGGAASLHNIVATVASSSAYAMTAIGPFPPSIFNDANGFCNMTYSVALPANSGFNVGVYSVAPRS